MEIKLLQFDSAGIGRPAIAISEKGRLKKDGQEIIGDHDGDNIADLSKARI